RRGTGRRHDRQPRGFVRRGTPRRGKEAALRAPAISAHPPPPAPLPQGERGARIAKSEFLPMGRPSYPSPLEGEGGLSPKAKGRMRGALSFGILLGMLLSPTLASAEPITVTASPIARFQRAEIDQPADGLI